MKYVWAACLAPLAVWLLMPFIIRYPSWVLAKTLPACEKGVTDPICVANIAMLGQSGDIYGMASSLFSGMALFAVAATLFADYLARKVSLKPLIVCTVEEAKEVAFEEPRIAEPRSVHFRASLNVKAAGDTALNTMVSASFVVGKFEKKLGFRSAQAPLLNEQEIGLEFYVLMERADLNLLIPEIDAGAEMRLVIAAQCNSMEGVSWQTTVAYKLSFKNNDIDMIRKFQYDDALLREAWKDGAAIGLRYEIVPGSWGHHRTRADKKTVRLPG